MNAINTGDTAFILISAALVMFMTPGLALFYGGMVRNKNVLGTIMHSFIILGLVTVEWVLWGYSNAFGPDLAGIIGSLDWFGLAGVGAAPFKDYAATIPHQSFMIFQMMFAIITPALITGTFAERMKFSTFVVFTLLWCTLVYNPVAHWVWGIGGWLRDLGALDFAGGTVVHINSGIAALAAALVIGKRKGYGHEPFHPHNLPMTITGGGHPLVRLVRLQCRQRPGGQRPGRLRPLSPPTSPRRRPPSPGSLLSGCIAANPPPWGRPAVAWPVWWP